MTEGCTDLQLTNHKKTQSTYSTQSTTH